MGGSAAMESHALPAHYLAPAAFTPGTAAYDAKLERMQEAVRALLEGVGEQPQREGLLDTPKVRWSRGCGLCVLVELARALLLTLAAHTHHNDRGSQRPS